MVKTTKAQQIGEKMREDIKRSKQTTLNSLPVASKAEPAKETAPKQKKQIEIIETSTYAREDELVLKVSFRLIPSRTSFSRITADLYFDGQKVDSLRLRILQGRLATDNSEFSSVLNMTGIAKGQHTLRVELYELWSSGERLTAVSKEVTFDYVPIRLEDRLIPVPIIKSVVGADLDVVTDVEKSIYR